MKSFLLISFFCFLSVAAIAIPKVPTNHNDTTVSITDDDVINNIVAAITAGDARKLATYFNTTVDLTIPSGDGTYSKSQAEMIVKNFFAQYPPVSFKINQQGSSNEGSQFSIGTLVTKTAKFRTYFLLKKVNGVSLIHQLQFETE
ncbi:MAG: DUF4783 domain-containing protein [Bacteroidota bacterium]